MVFWVLKDSFARLRLPKPDDTVGFLDVVVHPPHYIAFGHQAKLGKVIFKDIGRDILGKGTNVKPVARRKLTLLHFTMNYTPSLPHIKALNLVREKCPLFLLSWLPGSAVLALLLSNFWRPKGQGHPYCSVVHYVYLGVTALEWFSVSPQKRKSLHCSWSKKLFQAPVSAVPFSPHLKLALRQIQSPWRVLCPCLLSQKYSSLLQTQRSKPVKQQ